MENFELFNDDEFDSILNQNKFEEIQSNEDNINYKNCTECNIQMQPNINNTLTCPDCGFIKTVIIENLEYEPSMAGYNTNENYHIPIKCIGKNSFQYQKYLRNNTSQYSIIQETSIKRILEKLNYKSDNFIIPKNIIQNVLNQYKKIRETSKIHRGEILKGILGSLLYYECLKEGIIRKPKELAKWYEISENDLSKGDKILRDLAESGIIDLPINKDYNDEYIESYLKRMGLDIKYSRFLNELLKIINENKVGNPNARLSTKISALIFLLIISKKYNISTEAISEEFDISISTFKTFYMEIYKNKHLIDHVLQKYNIDLPSKIPRKPRINKKKEL
jgi:transcription initiation factor TFIIIB Brf1 subunit/transcription initiation factor TFIIB